MIVFPDSHFSGMAKFLQTSLCFRALILLICPAGGGRLQAGAGDRNLICFVLCHDGSRWSGGGWAAAAGGENLDLFSNYARWKSRKIHPDEDAKHMVGNLFKENFLLFVLFSF